MSIIERLLYGLKVSAIGMSVTFIGLIALVALVKLNQIIADSVNKIGKKEKPAEPVNSIETPEAVAKSEPDAASDDGVIAVITAAVSIMMEGNAFRVKSVKKAQWAVSNASAWDMVAISEQNNNL